MFWLVSASCLRCSKSLINQTFTNSHVNWAMWPYYNSWHLCQWVRTSIKQGMKCICIQFNVHVHTSVLYFVQQHLFFVIPFKKSKSCIFGSITKAAVVLFSVSNVTPTVLTQKVQVYRNTVLYIMGNFLRWLQEINHKSQNELSLLPSMLQYFILILIRVLINP